MVWLIRFIWGDNWLIFRPENADIDSEEFPIPVLIQQASIFGPVSLSLRYIADDEGLGIFANTLMRTN